MGSPHPVLVPIQARHRTLFPGELKVSLEAETWKGATEPGQFSVSLRHWDDKTGIDSKHEQPGGWTVFAGRRCPVLIQAEDSSLAARDFRPLAALAGDDLALFLTEVLGGMLARFPSHAAGYRPDDFTRRLRFTDPGQWTVLLAHLTAMTCPDGPTLAGHLNAVLDYWETCYAPQAAWYRVSGPAGETQYDYDAEAVAFNELAGASRAASFRQLEELTRR